MTEFEVNAELERTAGIKSINSRLLEGMRIAVTRFIKSGDLSVLSTINDCRGDKNFLESSESFRIGILVIIFVKEQRAYGQCVSVRNVADYKTLYEKYIYTVLMLRRIEQAADEAFSDDAYSYIQDNANSPFWISEILKAEYFENRRDIVANLINRLSDGLSEKDRTIWTNTIKAEIFND